MNYENSISSYIFPFLLAVVLHLVIGFAINFQWSSSEANLVQRDLPIYLNATLMRENPHTMKARQQAERKKQNRIARQKRQAAIKRTLEKETAAELEKERQARLQEQREQEKLREIVEKMQAGLDPVDIDDTDTMDMESERLLMEQGLSDAIKGEQEFRVAVTEDEKALAYVGQIKREIIQNWSRPPSARNGMQALLKVYLVPTGEVVDVVILESSNNEAFDRSAVLAVRKAERFTVPLDSRQFEKNFREFSVLFKPEDLRM